MTTATARVRLTLSQKTTLRAKHAAHPEMTRRELCEWALAAFALPRPLAKTTLRDILNKSDRGADDTELSPSRKASHKARCPQLETALVAWIQRCEELRLPIVTGATIRQKAKKICSELLARGLPSHVSKQLTAMTFSAGWLARFQSRNRLKSRRVHGEASSVDPAAVESGREALRKATARYAKKDIYNMDETAYYYCAVPSRTVSAASFSGRKHVKKRITVAITSSANGTSRPPLLFIGTARQPRCFGGKSSEQLGLQYASSPKGWMNSCIFVQWLERFNDSMREQGRKVLLLLDNVSSHRTDKMLSNTEVLMLPPNTTSHLQPQDAGIIQAFKAKISELKNEYVVERLDALLDRAEEIDQQTVEKEAVALYNADVLQAMKWAQEAWQHVTSSSIANCWRHTKIFDEEMYELVDSMGSCDLGV